MAEIDEVITVDVSDYVGADGRLTTEGLGKTRDELLGKLRRRFPNAADDSLARAVDDMMEGAANFRASDVQISIACKSLAGTLRRSASTLAELPDAAVSIARLIDHKRDDAGPHVFSCGQAAARMMSAIEQLSEAASALETMLAAIVTNNASVEAETEKKAGLN